MTRNHGFYGNNGNGNNNYNDDEDHNDNNGYDVHNYDNIANDNDDSDINNDNNKCNKRKTYIIVQIIALERCLVDKNEIYVISFFKVTLRESPWLTAPTQSLTV